MSGRQAPDLQFNPADARASGLRPYQVAGISFLLSEDAVLLADEMGLGKTVQAAMAIRLAGNQFERVLVVVPSSLCLNWQREFARWAPEVTTRRVIGDIQDRLATYRLPVKVLIASFEQLRQDYKFMIGLPPFDLVVLDEAQRIKNSSSEISLACRLTPRNKSWALTGTPLENRPEDIISIFRFLRPSMLKRGMNREDIHRLIRPYFMRRTKNDVLGELPPIIYRDVQLELTDDQRDAYDLAWERRYASSCENGVPATSNMLATVTRLKQICNYEPSSGASSKLEVIQGLIEQTSSPTDKIIIFSQYAQSLFWLSSRLNVRNSVYHGQLSQDDRDTVVRDFENRVGPSALLMTYRAGGVGLNLQSASTVILFDRWWNPAIENQAIARAHRYGRLTPLTVVHFTTAGTVEERIADLLQLKRILFTEYVDAAASEEVGEYPNDLLLRILNLPGSAPS